MPSYSRTVQIPGKSAVELYEKVAVDVERMLSKLPVGDFKIDRTPSKQAIEVKSKAFSFKLQCKEGCVALDGSIGFLLVPFRSKIDEGIDSWLKKNFPQS
jgi:hypothetical protein